MSKRYDFVWEPTHPSFSHKREIVAVSKRDTQREMKLQSENPREYSHFEEVCSVREYHIVKEVPSQYAFTLLPCYQPGCPHPVCKKGKPKQEP